MSAAHTPGPWAVSGAGRHALVRGEDLTIVAVRHRLEGDVHEANACLIAAAPDLLEALEQLLDDLDALAPAKPCIEAIEQAQAAIAKARGEA